MTISKSTNKSRITIGNILNESKNHIIDDIENNEEFFITYFDIPENNNNELPKYYTKTEEIDDTNIIFIDNVMHNFSKKPVKIVKK